MESRTEMFHEGQRAIVLPGIGEQGGLAEYIVSGPERLAALPDNGPLDEWVMCQPSGTVLYSCHQMPNLLGKTVLVLGQGSIGLSFSMITSLMGARNVIGADLLDYRLVQIQRVRRYPYHQPQQRRDRRSRLGIHQRSGARRSC